MKKPKHAKKIRSLADIIDFIDAKYDALYEWLFGKEEVIKLVKDVGNNFDEVET